MGRPVAFKGKSKDIPAQGHTFTKDHMQQLRDPGLPGKFSVSVICIVRKGVMLKEPSQLDEGMH